MDSKQMASLAEYFGSDPTAKEAYRACNPTSKVVNNYIFSSKLVKHNIHCALGNSCEWFKAKSEEQANEDLQKMIVCISCDRIYHLRCTGVDIKALSPSLLPWTCYKCIGNPLNPEAQALVTSKKHLWSFDERIKYFFKEIKQRHTLSESSSDGTGDEKEQTFHLTSSHNIIPSEITAIINKLTQRCDNLEKKNNELQLKLDEQVRMSVTNRNAGAEPSIPARSAANYSDAVLKINKASTSVDENIKESLMNQGSIFGVSSVNEKDSLHKAIFGHNVERYESNPGGSHQASFISNIVQNNVANAFNSNTIKGLHKSSSDSNLMPNNVRNFPAMNNNNSRMEARSYTATNEPQLEVTTQHLNMLTLNEIRRHLPKIVSFDGKPEKWLTFQRDVERNWREGQYSDEMMKHQIRHALHGQALYRVEALMDYMSTRQIMELLKESYGNSNIIMESARQKLLNAKLSKPLTHASCIEITTYIANYMSSCTYAGLLATDTNISTKIHNQLDPFHQQMYYEYFFRKFPNATTRMERLDTQFEFLNQLAKTLPIGSFKVDESKSKNKGNNYQVLSASINTTSSYKSYPNKNPTCSNDNYKYELRDKETARYLGYDMDKVKDIPKHCLICGKSNHFSVECRTYREMRMDAKFNVAKVKKLCINCLLTADHTAKDCTIKSGCGFKLDKNARCSAKHHVTLHRGTGSFKPFNNAFNKPKRRSHTNVNADRANDRIESAQQNQISNNNSSMANKNTPIAHSSGSSTVVSGQQHVVYGYPVEHPTQVPTTESSKPYQILMTKASDKEATTGVQNTVKLFKTIFHGNGNKAIGFAIGDSAAEITLIQKQLTDDLGITGEHCLLDLQWTDSTVKRTDAYKVRIRIAGVSKGCKILELDDCYAVSDLNLPPRSLNVESLKKQFPYLENIPFASYSNEIPVMLIGSRHAYMVEAIEPVVQSGNDNPIAIRSLLGYSIYGGAPETFTSSYCISSHNVNIIDEKVEENLEAMDELNKLYIEACSIDSLGIKPAQTHYTKDEKAAIKLMDEEMKALPDGTIEVPLIWNKVRNEIPKLPDNFPMVYKRQEAQEKKLSKNPELLEAYNNNFLELIKQGYVRSATERDMGIKWPNVSYLPMSLVVNRNKTPVKTRNVYDASAKYQGISLNDKLLMGPNLLVDMLKPLMRMRLFKYAFTADIKSMFHRVKICERDQQCQRILWRPEVDQPMQVFIQQVMLFGPKCSPFVSQIVKNRTAEKWSHKYPDAAKAITDFTYMDDMLTSETTEDAAINVAEGAIEIFKSINWDLVSFQSNSLEVLQALNPENVKQDLYELMTTEELNYSTKVLGVIWNPKIDAFTFQLNKNAFIKMVKDCGLKPTKRDQCSTIARIFDALGFLSNCIILGKILLQRSWRHKLNWDEEVSDEEHREWTKWLNDLEKVTLLKIPRLRFRQFNISEASSLELHTFSDAGKEAFAAVSYMVATINNYRHVSFVMSKAKVAPIKLQTRTQISEMPRLEMLSCLIAARLTTTIKTFHQDFKMDTYHWTDSEIVLNWIKNDNIKLPRFAISPIEEIIELTGSENWNHVESKSNTADLATKFQKQNFGDINSPWFQGPKFLKLPKSNWPVQKMKSTSNESTLVGNINRVSFCNNQNVKIPATTCELANDFIIDLLSPSITCCWSKLVRAVGRALKFYYNAIIPLLKSKQWRDREARQLVRANCNFMTLTPIEWESAEQFIVRRIQRETYPIEYDRLSKNKRISNVELLQLNVFMDSNGLMRISSRVNVPKKTYGHSFSPLVSRKSDLSTALLFHYHYKHNHVGIEAQVADFRSKYWMPQLRSALKKIQSLCNYCAYMRANPVEYKMAPLPNVRIDRTLQPFEVTGLDCAGPFTIYARNGHTKKVWILIFTCTVTRFIHLHVLDEMTSMAVLEAIMILWTSHGPVKQFISDNGTNFVGAANIVQSDAKKLIQFLKQSNKELESKLAEELYVSWTFIPVQSPWFGAFYERLIQTVKKSIASAIEGRRVSRMSFNIALQDAAHRINNRPLTHNPISAEDEEVLTPHHLAKNRSGWPLLPSIHGMKDIPDPLSDKNQYRQGRLLAEEMTRKFNTQYLPVLAKRTKWFKDFKPIKAGDLVLLIDPNCTRKAWERARVIKVYVAKDKNVRVADIMLPDGSIRKNRSAHRLAKLDIQQI